MDSSSSCRVFNVEEEVVVIRNGWTPKREREYANIVFLIIILQIVCDGGSTLRLSILHFAGSKKKIGSSCILSNHI